MGLPVEGFTLHRPDILGLLILNMDQRPLPPAEAKMLNPGDQEVVILGKHTARPLESLQFRPHNPQNCEPGQCRPFG